MFEKASRMKLRFPYTKGQCSVEDLWDMKLQDLDLIYKKLNVEKTKSQGEKSLLQARSAQDTTLDLQLAVVEHVFTVRRAEQLAREAQAANAREIQTLMGVLADKQHEQLKTMTPEELTARINALQAAGSSV